MLIALRAYCVAGVLRRDLGLRGVDKMPIGLALKSVRRKSVCRKNRKLIVQATVFCCKVKCCFA